jgi:hypothetical protein
MVFNGGMMKLIKIKGKIWELSCLQSDEYAVNDEITITEANFKTIQGQGWYRGIVRVLSSNGVKSKATAVIETTVNGLPSQMNYEIYHNSKGFFCKVQGKRIFLKDLISDSL